MLVTLPIKILHACKTSFFYNGNAGDGVLRVHMQDKNLGIKIYKAKICLEEYKMLEKKKGVYNTKHSPETYKSAKQKR